MDVIKDVMGAEYGMDVSKVNLPLSGDQANTLNDLISKGLFKDKSDFVSFLALSYMKNNLGASMIGGQAPSESTVMDIISKSGLGKKIPEGQAKMLVPLLITGFMAIYKYMSRKQHAAKPA